MRAELENYQRHLKNVKAVKGQWGIKSHMQCLESLYGFYTQTEQDLEETKYESNEGGRARRRL